jgi:hypothetical protein
MFLLTIGCLAAAGGALAQSAAPVLPLTLAVIAVLTGITACRRTVRLCRKLHR